MPKGQYQGSKDQKEYKLRSYFAGLNIETATPPDKSASDLWADCPIDGVVKIQYQTLKGNKIQTTNRDKYVNEKEYVSEKGKKRNRYHYSEEGIDWIVTENPKKKRYMWYHIDTYSQCPDYIDITEVPEDNPPWEFQNVSNKLEEHLV